MWGQSYHQRINLYPKKSCQVRSDCQLIHGYLDCSKTACGTWQLTHKDAVVYFNFLASALKSLLLKNQDQPNYFTNGLSNTNVCTMCKAILGQLINFLCMFLASIWQCLIMTTSFGSGQHLTSFRSRRKKFLIDFDSSEPNKYNSFEIKVFLASVLF